MCSIMERVPFPSLNGRGSCKRNADAVAAVPGHLALLHDTITEDKIERVCERDRAEQHQASAVSGDVAHRTADADPKLRVRNSSAFERSFALRRSSVRRPHRDALHAR